MSSRNDWKNEPKPADPAKLSYWEYSRQLAEEYEDTNEVRMTDPITGGQKGVKPERHDLVPIFPLDEEARVYAFGAEKYEDNNWRKGYPWGWSYASARRHMQAFWSGESRDRESRLHHLAHAKFHLNALMEFERLGLGTDDRVIDE